MERNQSKRQNAKTSKRRNVKTREQTGGFGNCDPNTWCFDFSTFRRFGVLLVWAAVATAGCASTGSFGDRSQDGSSGAGQAGIDVSRAYLPLTRIEPVPSRPVRPQGLKPLSARASRQIAKANRLVGEQRYTEAAIELERALRYDPNHHEIHRTLATLHWDAGNIERARTHARRALERNPNDAAAHYIDGRCHSLDGDNAAAIAAYRTALLCSGFERQDAIAALCHYHLAKALASEGYLEAALKQYSAFEMETATLLRRATVSEAATPPETASLLSSNRGSAREAKSNILEMLGRFARAAEELAPLVAGAPGDASLSLRYAGLLTRAGRFDQALTAARAIPSDSEEVMELLFTIHQQAGHPERIIDELHERMVRRPEKAGLVLRLVEMLLRLGRGDDARRELEKYLERHPDAHMIRSRLADVHIAESAWLEALRVCAEGLQRRAAPTVEFTAKITALAANEEAVGQLLRPPAEKESPGALYLRGALAISAGRLEEAEGLLRRAYDRRPDFVLARVELARVYFRSNRYEAAIHVADRTDSDTAEDARLETVLGEVYERLDDFDRAELHFRTATQLDRTDTKAMFALAKLYSQSRRGLRAQRQLLVLLEKEPDHEAAREMLALSYLAERKPDVAIEQFEELRRRATTPITKARCAAMLDQVHKGDAVAYREALLRALEQHAPDAATWVAVAESYDPNSEPEARLEAYHKALAIDADNEDVAIGLVQTSQYVLAFEDSAEWLKALLQRRPNRHSWRFGRFQRGRGLIELYWIIQDFDAALALARNAEARKDLDDLWRSRYRIAIVDTLRQAGRSEEALEQLKKWVEAEPDRREWATLLAEEYLRQDQAALAVPVLEEIHRSDATGAGLPSLVEALVAAGRHDRASQHVLDWLSDDPENDNAIMRLVGILVDAKRFDDALELVHNRLLRTLERQQFQNLAIALLAMAGRHDDGIDLVEALIDEVVTLMDAAVDPHGKPPEGQSAHETVIRLPDEPFTVAKLHRRLESLRRRLAGTLIAAKQYQTAEQRLSSWLDTSREPSDRFWYLRQLALCHRARGDEPRASEIIERALLLQPRDVTLNNDVAYGWIDQGVRLEEAERMIRYALSRVPQQAAYLDTYGWLLYKKGGFAEAKKWLLRAAGARGGADPVVQDHLGDACWRLDQSEEALRYWKGAVETLGKRGDDELNTDDQRRVRRRTQTKIDDAQAGRSPIVAPLAADPPTRERE